MKLNKISRRFVIIGIVFLLMSLGYLYSAFSVSREGDHTNSSSKKLNFYSMLFLDGDFLEESNPQSSTRNSKNQGDNTNKRSEYDIIVNENENETENQFSKESLSTESSIDGDNDDDDNNTNNDSNDNDSNINKIYSSDDTDSYSNNSDSSDTETSNSSHFNYAKILNKYLYHHKKSYEFPSQFFIDTCGGEDNWKGLFESFIERQKRFVRGRFEDRKRIKAIVYKHIPTLSDIGERVNGYTTSFMVALLTGRAFFVDETSSDFPFSGFFQFADPTITWKLNPQILRGLTVWKGTIVWTTKDPAQSVLVVKKFWSGKVLSDEQLRHDVIVVRGNSAYSGFLRMNYNYADVLINTYWSRIPFHSTHNCLVNFLLQPTSRLQEKTEKARQTMFGNRFGENYYQIGMQIYKGSQQSNSYDPNRISMNGEKLFFSCAKQLEKRVLAEWSQNRRQDPAPKVVFFLTTDSIDTQKRAKKELKDQLCIWEGGVAPLEKTNVMSEDDQISLLVQYVLLGSSNTAIVTKSPFGISSARRGTDEFFSIKSIRTTYSCLDDKEVTKCDPVILNSFKAYFDSSNCSLPLASSKLFEFFGAVDFKKWVESKIMLDEEQVLLGNYFETMSRTTEN